MAKDAAMQIGTFTPQRAATLASMLGAAVVGVGLALVAKHPEYLLEALAACLLFLAAMLVVTANNSRAAGIWLIVAVTPAVTATAVTVVGPVEVSQLAPLGLLAVTFLPGVARARSAPSQPGRWALLVALGLVVGGWLATLAGGGDVLPMIALTLTTVPTVWTVLRLDPDEGELSLIITALLVGILTSTVVGVTALQSASGRSLGFTHHSNQFAMQAVLAAPLLWMLWRQRKVPTALAWVGLAVLVAGLAQSGSRSGVIAAAVVFVIWTVRRFGLPALIAVAVAGVCLVLVGAVPSVNTPTTNRLLDPSLTKHSNEARLETMSAGLDRLRQDPLLGQGYPHSGPLPHNVVLLVWGSLGLLGLVAFLFLVWRIVRAAVFGPLTAWSWPIALALMAFLADTSLNNSVATPTAWLLIGCLALKQERVTRGSALPQRVPTAGC